MATFADLPVELVIRIVSFAIETNLKDAKRLYLSLVLVSSRMQEIAHVVCLSQFPIMLHTLHSFRNLLERHPTAASNVRNLWFNPNFWEFDVQIAGPILLACHQIERLACSGSLLSILTHSPPPFRHDRLRDLTITSGTIAWGSFSPTLFGRLTHLRWCDRLPFDKLPFCFASLTHLSFSVYGLDIPIHRAVTFDSTFPSLRHIVPTLSHIYCSKDSHSLRADVRRRGADDRVELLPCPKMWEESKVWEMAKGWGEPSIWECAELGIGLYDW